MLYLFIFFQGSFFLNRTLTSFLKYPDSPICPTQENRIRNTDDQANFLIHFAGTHQHQNPTKTYHRPITGSQEGQHHCDMRHQRYSRRNGTEILLNAENKRVGWTGSIGHQPNDGWDNRLGQLWWNLGLGGMCIHRGWCVGVFHNSVTIFCSAKKGTWTFNLQSN